jgi:hypothetical protein
MTENCDECGAPLLNGPLCQDNFHALLVLEGQVEGAPGSLTHFYTVACYVLQHPVSMNYTVDAFEGLKESLLDAIEGRATLVDLRRRTRRAAEGATRILRREGDPLPESSAGKWQLTVADMLLGGADAYVENAMGWARSIANTVSAR